MHQRGAGSPDWASDRKALNECLTQVLELSSNAFTGVAAA